MLGIQKRATIPSQDDDGLLKSAQFKDEGLLSKVHLNPGGRGHEGSCKRESLRKWEQGVQMDQAFFELQATGIMMIGFLRVMLRWGSFVDNYLYEVGPS